MCMLCSIYGGKYVIQVPHKADFTRWMKNLSSSDYQEIADTLNEKKQYRIICRGSLETAS